MHEVYLGSSEDRRYISTYLANIRYLDPKEIVTLPNSIRIGDGDQFSKIVDVQVFWDIVDSAISICVDRHSVAITKLLSDRCYVALPPEDDVCGGFHDERSLGYQYWYHASSTVVLNCRVASKELRTIELARNYLHDCLHHKTFRTFRRALRVPASSPAKAKQRVPEIYREQYGINYRNQDGLSYPSRQLTTLSPRAINLN